MPDFERAVAPYQRVLIPSDIRIHQLEAHAIDHKIRRDADSVSFSLTNADIANKPARARRRILSPGRLPQSWRTRERIRSMLSAMINSVVRDSPSGVSVEGTP